MKELNDSERLEVAMSLLGERQIDEYAERCKELEHIPAECEDYECRHCPLYYDEMGKKQIGCPYVD